jgi:hypothetical protein
MKQTAVEWFEEKVEQHLLTFGSIQPNVLSKFKQEAKEMEKQQIETAYQAGDGDAYNLEETKSWALQYYKETYGGNK